MPHNKFNATTTTTGDCSPTDVPWWISLLISFNIYLINVLFIFFRWLHNWRKERIAKKKNEDICRERIKRIYKGSILANHQPPELSSDDNASDYGARSDMKNFFNHDRKLFPRKLRLKRLSSSIDHLSTKNASLIDALFTNKKNNRKTALLSSSKCSIAGMRENRDSFILLNTGIIPERRSTSIGIAQIPNVPCERKKKDNRCFHFLANHHMIFWSPKYQLKVKLFCEQWTSFSYQKGRYMGLIFMILSTISWLIYIVGTVDAPPDITKGVCLSRRLNILGKLSFIINLFFLAYFILKLCASNNRKMFIFKVQSCVDVVAIPSALINAFLHRRYIDLDFIRAVNIFKYSEVFAYMGLLTSNNRLQAAQISFAMFAMWMFGSGMMHIINHLGDIWLEEDPQLEANRMSFFSCCYFLLVTMSTVGYGDIAPTSTISKVFICVFVCVSMGVFASFWPELIRSFDSNSNIPTGKYRTIFGQKHVLVCGHFNNESIRSFLKGFFRKEHATKRKTLNMVILRPITMDLSLKAILTKYNAWVHYFTGTPNNPQDLNRINLKDARAAIVLASPHSKFSDDEDGANIMQAITLKAQRERLRVLVQLHHSRNKSMLNNFPRWTCISNDMVMCMDEFKLGLMAYNCIAPGFSTLILNLLNSYKIKNDYPKNVYRNWRTEYEYSLAMNLYDVGISHSFHRLDARELAVFMHECWQTVLVAIKCIEKMTGKHTMVINPSLYDDLIIDSYTMRAIVIAESSVVARLLEFYCNDCNAHEDGRICSCNQNRMNRAERSSWTDKRKSQAYFSYILEKEQLDKETSFEIFRTSARSTSDTLISVKDPDKDRLQIEYKAEFHDRTGTFHWIPDVPIARAILSPAQARMYNFSDHIVLCLVGPIAGGPIDLVNFVMPFRFHWLPVRSIVILGEANLISETEWIKLRNFPRVYIVDGSPCSFTDLHAVQILKCYACAIIGETGSSSKFDEYDISLQDKNTLFCAMNIKSLIKREARSIHITTELRHENNAHHFTAQNFLEADLKLSLRFQEPYAHGIIFSNSLLYSSVSALYFNQNVFHFLKALISGRAFEEIESLFSFGTGLQEELKEDSKEKKKLIPGVKVELRALNATPFCIITDEERSLGTKPSYRTLFQRSLMYWRILCLGLYRLNENNMRYVFTNPPADTVLLETDKVYCFSPQDFVAPQRPKPLQIIESSDD